VTTTAKPIPERIIAWLRAGYPQGIPREDYIALFAVLHRRLTDTEVRSIADELIADAKASGDGEIDRTEIEAAIQKLALETPGDEDVARVASRLAAGGWPLADPAE
jgi:RNase P/RNase MRP subunit POP5